MKALRYSLPFFFLATVPLGFVLGGVGSFLTILVIPIAIAGLDGMLGSEFGSETFSTTPIHRLLPRLYIPAQLATTAWAAWTISHPAIPLADAIGLTLSVGVIAGVFGMLAAHEMAHSPSRFDHALGLGMLASVGYMHFSIAHIHGHHVRAATPQDPASARRGESAYVFVVRSVAGQVAEAWSFEASRLRRRRERVIGRHNRMLGFLAIEVAIAAAAGAALGPRALAFLLAQAVLAIILLELFNYIAHYGLVRRLTASGRPERLADRHSWNSARRMNNWTLFNMGRHSDHHRHPARGYGRLEAVEGSPELPSGYAGAILLALVPPLWRRVMDPRADAWNANTT